MIDADAYNLIAYCVRSTRAFGCSACAFVQTKGKHSLSGRQRSILGIAIVGHRDFEKWQITDGDE
ncbi:MAG: hypothetical protein EAZ24_09765 [Burkholderiales bacterium]|nr:MAG: hypothetical protein EAZ24_09765 [Burkholderiales bacterium]TAG81551.1 MAG: hypothetical protein EAZ21_05665 [Betaproteobacteria bacterium]